MGGSSKNDFDSDTSTGSDFHYYGLEMVEKKKNAKAIIYKTPDRVIPVVFLPGVMGSNLMSKEKDGDLIWRLDSIPGTLVWTTRGPAQRGKLLDPSNTFVDPRGAVQEENMKERRLFGSRTDRGWGEVGYMSYGDFLPWLQKVLNDNDEKQENQQTGNGKLTAREKLENYNLNAEVGETNLTTDEVNTSYKYLFPVHAAGYNWLASNSESAKNLSIRITKIINDYHSRGMKCEKVILVTHSMGGLVARHYSEMLKSNNGDSFVLGIVHGVMPDLGSPMAYKRMKMGEAGTTGLVIGANGAEMTPVLAKAPGPLQLLPGVSYGMGWLHIEGKKELLPESDPYTEIYTNRTAWWALREERFISPNLDNSNFINNEWLSYKDIINFKVKPFIEELNGHYHNNTYAFYGNDGAKYPSYAQVCWKDISSKKHSDLDDAKLVNEGVIFYPADINNQTTRYIGLITKNDGNIYKKFEFMPPKDPGDGTVPVCAAVIHSSKLKSQIGLSVDHEGAYKKFGDVIDSRLFSLRSIIKIAYEVKKTSLAYV